MNEYEDIKSGNTPRDTEILEKSPEIAQGSQGRQHAAVFRKSSSGIQMSTFRTNIEDGQIDSLNIEFPRESNLNSTQTNELLNVEHNNIDRMLQ